MGMVKMKHINIYGPEQDPQQTLEVLAKLACFHPDKDAERINAAAGAAENLYTPLLASTLGLIKDVGGDPALQEYRGRFFEYGAVKDEVEALSAQVAERGKRQAEISAKLATYAQTKTQLYHLTGLHTSVDEIFACKYLKVRFGRIPKDSYLKLPYYDDHSFTFSEYDFDGEYYWGMYFVPESHAKEVDDIFANLYFERMWVPDFVHGTPQDALAQIMTQESELQAEQKELDNMSDIAAPADIERLREYASWLNYEMQVFDMRKYVITLEHTYYISGYVPESDVERLKQGLLMVHGVKACEDDEADAVDGAPDRQPPVKLKNNWFARPFEMFITMYGLPGYGDLDPTGFVAVTYALLFGIMFGDVGQGVLLGLSLIHIWKPPPFGDGSNGRAAAGWSLTAPGPGKYPCPADNLPPSQSRTRERACSLPACFIPAWWTRIFWIPRPSCPGSRAGVVQAAGKRRRLPSGHSDVPRPPSKPTERDSPHAESCRSLPGERGLKPRCWQSRRLRRRSLPLTEGIRV